MLVTLKCFAGLRGYLPDDSGETVVEMAQGATVGELIDRFSIPRHEPKIILVNGRHTDMERPIVDGDVVSAFPPVAGG